MNLRSKPLARRTPLLTTGRCALALTLLTSSVHCSGSSDGGVAPASGGAAGAGGTPSGAAGSSGTSAGGDAPGAGGGGPGGAAGSASEAGSAGVGDVDGGEPVAEAGPGGAGGQGGSATPDAGRAGMGGGGMPEAGPPKPLLTCDDVGPEPVVPAPCATVMATKAVAAGKPANEAMLDTQAIQAAIDACPAGQAVKLATAGASTGFVSGPLNMKTGVSLWIDAGVTLFASRNPADFDSKAAGQCGSSASNSACTALINVVRAANVSIVGKGIIDGRGGEVVTGGTATWWELENTDAGKLAAPRLIQVSASQNFTLYQLTLQNAPKFHVVIDGTQGYRVWGITINTPKDAPNTDGVDPSASSDGIIAYNKITTGDDNIAIKAGGGAMNNLVIAHNHFGRGHGMSIGSETNAGVSDVKVCDLSLDGTDNGLRIKSDSSRGGLVHRISYTDVCMRNVVKPIVLDSYYSTATGALIPDFRDVTMKNVHVLGTGGKLTFRGYDAVHPVVVTLDNVVFDAAPSVTAVDAHLTMGPGPVGFTASGTRVTTTEVTPRAAATPLACDNAFTTF